MHRGNRARSDDKLFTSTKGAILVALCRGPRTVNELAAQLSLTDNGIRAQLQRLARDGLVRRAGSRPGTRRPHADYELTPEGRAVFPTAYEPVLVELVDVLAAQLPPKVTRGLLDAAVRTLFRRHVGTPSARDPRGRLRETLAKLQELAPGIELQEDATGTRVRSCSCPLAAATAARPELCGIFAAALSDLLRADLRERCERNGSPPRCCFELPHGTPARPPARAAPR